MRAMRHRGPDADGLYEADGLVAGMCRLAVIDLDGGRQPIANEDGSVEVVFNGEIYNYRELRDSLIAAGHRFRTASDTEVLVHLWEEHGEGMLDRLNGMFAFCLHDRRLGRTLIARDRLGIKPLFLAMDGRRIAFASELGVLLHDPQVNGSLDSGRLIDLFCLQYVPGDETPYRHVRKLLPGHYLVVDADGCRIRRWWALPPFEPTAGLSTTPAASEIMSADRSAPPATSSVATSTACPNHQQQTEELESLLDSAVRYRTIADVPLGLFLSGGLDSSVLCALLAEHADGPIETFSVGFDDAAAWDERRHARVVAEALGATHHEQVVSAEQIALDLPELIAHLRLPVTDPALLPTWRLARFARQHVTVALGGEGADELFGGYRRYAYQHRFAALGRVPGTRWVEPWLPRRMAQALEALAERHPARNSLIWSSTVGLRLARSLFAPAALESFAERAIGAFERHWPTGTLALEGQLRTDQAEWLPHNLLAKIDHATMAHSLEARVPFLDHRLVEWAARLPASAKIAGPTTKRILRETFGPKLPPSIRNRPKRGFDLPLAEWIRGPLRDLAESTLGTDLQSRWPELQADAVQRMLRRHLDGREDFGLPLFLLVSMATFLEGES